MSANISIVSVMRYENNNNAKAHAVDGFRRVLDILKYRNKVLKLWDKKHREFLFNEWVKYMNQKMGDWYTADILNKWGFTDKDIFAEEIIDNFDYFESCKYFADNINNIIPAKVKKLSKNQAYGQKMVEELGIKGVSVESASDLYNEDNVKERLLVVRNRWGKAEPLVYVFEGACEDINVRKFRAAYAWETKTNYYEAAPILYITCLKDPERFYSTKKDEYNDDIVEYDKNHVA